VAEESKPENGQNEEETSQLVPAGKVGSWLVEQGFQQEAMAPTPASRNY